MCCFDKIGCDCLPTLTDNGLLKRGHSDNADKQQQRQIKA